MSTPSPFVFVSSPVSSQNPYEVLNRIETAARFAAWLQENEGKCPFSAAVHDVSVSKYLTKPKGSDWWRANIQYFMRQAESCCVLCLEGWEKSSGVTLEIEMAKRFNVAVHYYQPAGQSFERMES